MFVFGYFLSAVATVLNFALVAYMWIIVARAILSWVSPDPYNPIVRFINRATEPALAPIRRRIPLAFGGIDFSPILVILLLVFLQQFLVQSLYHLAGKLM